MSNSSKWERRGIRGPHEGIISALSVGAVFILFGLVFVLASPNNLWDKIIAFFSNITAGTIPGTSIVLPTPANPGIHTVFYNAVFQLSLGIAFLEVLVLALRVGFGSGIRRIAETSGNLVFWFGASALARTYLNSSTMLREWFAFWALILVVLGLSIVVRAAVQLAKR